MPSSLVDFDQSGAAEYAHTTEQHIKQLRLSGELPFTRVGKLVRVAKADLDAYLARQRVDAALEQVAKRLIAQRVEQGLPPTVEDAEALAHIAAVLNGAAVGRT